MNANSKRADFLHQVEELCSKSKSESTYMFTQAKCASIVNELLATKEKTKSNREYHLLDRFTIITVNGVGRLAIKEKATTTTTGEAGFRYVVPIEEAYDKLLELHVRLGHAGKNKMLPAIASQHHTGLTVQMVKIFLSLCEECQLKRKQPRKLRFGWA